MCAAKNPLKECLEAMEDSVDVLRELGT